MSPLQKIMFIGGISLAAIIISPFWGAIGLTFSNLVNDTDTQLIFFSLRVPRVILGFVVGGSLALCGLCFQAILKNPLAEPYTLGVASGSALGVACYIYMGRYVSFLGLSGLVMAAILGALLVMIVLLLAAKKHQSPFKLLLFGVIINFFCGSLVSLLQAMGSMSDTFKMSRWMMGSLENTASHYLFVIIPLLLGFCLLIWRFAPRLSVLSTGQEMAHSRGVNVWQSVQLFYFLMSLITGISVAFCGPIGFLGLIIPHIARAFFGSHYTYLCIASFLLGGSLLVSADALARIVLAPAELPVGILTALIGAPFFVWILLKR